MGCAGSKITDEDNEWPLQFNKIGLVNSDLKKFHEIYIKFMTKTSNGNQGHILIYNFLETFEAQNNNFLFKLLSLFNTTSLQTETSKISIDSFRAFVFSIWCV